MVARSDALFKSLRPGLLVLLALLLFPSLLSAADTNSAPAAASASDEAWRTSILLQEQLKQTQLAIEKNRLESEAQAASNAGAFAQRLDLLEKNLAAQRLNDINSENHTILLSMSIFAGIMLLVLIVSSYIQWNAVNRLASAATGMSLTRQMPMLGMESGSPSIVSQALAQSGPRFLDVIERLEQRIHHFESANKGFHPAAEHGNGNANGAPVEVPSKALPSDGSEAATHSKVSLLVGKSQTLMKMNNAEAALAALDEALSIEPDNADASIKKGAVLEHLDRLDEALRCYDHAIALDRSTTMAYLYKGALYNRMQRYNESLACYEQALRANDRRPSPDLSLQSE